MKFNAVIEIPKDSPIKYEYDEDTGEFIADFEFKNGFTYKYNYGFIPGTLAGDGDTLDVIVLSDNRIAQGTVVDAVPIGMIEMLDRGQVDNKIIAIPADSISPYLSIKDLTTKQLQEFRDFFAEVARQKDKIIIIKDFLDYDIAIKEISKCAEHYKNRHK